MVCKRSPSWFNRLMVPAIACLYPPSTASTHVPSRPTLMALTLRLFRSSGRAILPSLPFRRYQQANRVTDPLYISGRDRSSMIIQQIGLDPAHSKVRVFRRQGLRKFRRCTFNQLRFLLKGAIGLPSFRRLINMPFYFRFPEICFVSLGVLPLARPFSRPQKRGSPSTSCCCSASFMIADPA